MIHPALEIFFWLVTGMYSFQLGLSALLDLWRNQKLNAHHHSHKVSVVIPFKNERESGLPLLIPSLNKAYLPGNEFIFVNDGSSDSGSEFIEKNAKFPHKIIQVPPGFSGKKAAIHAGVSASSHAFVLSLDADVQLPENYFKALKQLEWSDLVILPVQMMGNTPFQTWNSIEFDFLQHLTHGLAGRGMPSLCNGANLLFSKKAYQEAASIRTDWHIPSGDDVFLLNAMNHLKKSIKAIDHPELRVVTEAPKTWKELLGQRLRWIGKMRGKWSWEHIPLIGFLYLSQWAFLPVLLVLFIDPYFLIPIVIKLVAERMASRSSSFSALAIHQFYYPIYLLIVLGNLLFGKAKTWN